ncbi:unnamed protein product [Closterium sp. Naga37s-1]|nr:unnamed protein product [Closterium sp. Naga37s-1]
MARAASSAFVARAVRRNLTSLARIEAGVDAVCRGVREVEGRLVGEFADKGSAGGEDGKVLAAEAGRTAGAGSGSGEGAGAGAGAGAGVGEGAGAKRGTWPEACWPVPHMPFSDVKATRASKFLVFAHSDEQLSSTRSHLAEAARFAQATNRILVLPKCSRSRLSLARDLPLCAYFDLSRLDAHWISPDLFLLLARAALNPPFAAAAPGTSPSVAFVHLQMQQLWHMPFSQRSLVDMLSELMVYGMGHAPSRRNTLDIAMPVNSRAVFHQLHKWRHTDVLVWVKSTFGLVDFKPPTEAISFNMFPYNRAWHATAHRALARLPPRYIAVHYRSEFIAFNLGHRLAKVGYKLEAGVLEGLMAGCMEAARDLINGMKRRHNISAVFIAADVPFDGKAGSVVRSDSWNETTWKFQGAEKERALQAPREKLRWLREQVAGTVMVDELMPAVNKYDPAKCSQLLLFAMPTLALSYTPLLLLRSTTHFRPLILSTLAQA